MRIVDDWVEQEKRQHVTRMTEEKANRLHELMWKNFNDREIANGVDTGSKKRAICAHVEGAT